MYFDSLSSLLSMDGHGWFVWSAVIFSLALMSLLAWVPVWLTRRFFMRQNRSLAFHHPTDSDALDS